MACLSDATMQAFLEHTLTSLEEANARAHIDGCDDCRELLAALARETIGSFGRYEVASPIGAGAIGIVYRAHDRELDRDVALKVLRSGSGSLATEAQAMARLQHANVVSVYDVGRVGDQTFIAMELVAGGTLTAWLASRKHAWRAIAGVFVQAGRGLAAAHAAGIVHGDFKPDNVLIGADGAARVADFGLAGETTRGGTPAYMAPEQLAKQPSDARADQFAWCIAFYEALENRRPFDQKSSTRDALALAIEQGPRPWRARVPRGLKRAIERGLRRDPADRYASMDALLADVTAALEPPRVWPWMAVGALVAGVAALALAARRDTPSDDPFAPDPAIAGPYAQALDELRARHVPAARALLEEALATSPHDALARSALAAALATVCRDSGARSEATKALADRADLAPAGRLLVEGRAYSALHDWPNAVTSFTALAGIYPGDVPIGLGLATAQLRAGAAANSLATLSALPADDPQVGLGKGNAYAALGDVKAARDAAKRVGDAARARGDRAVLARALQQQALAEANVGELASAVAHADEAIQLFDAVGDPVGKMQSLDTAATARNLKGDSDASQALFEQEVAGARETGCEEQAANALNNLAVVRYQRGDLAGARALFEQALPGFRAAGNKSAEGNTLHNLAGLAIEAGDLESARTLAEQALAVARQLADQRQIATALEAEAWILRDLGELDEARRALAEALRIVRASGDRELLADILVGAYELDHAAGDSDAADKDLDEAQAIAKPAGFAEVDRNARQARAVTLLDAGHTAEAAAALAALIDELHAAGATVQEAGALCELAGAYDELGRTTESKAALVRAIAIHSDQADVRFDIALFAGRTDAQALQSLADTAATQHWFEHAWHARLALAQLRKDASAIRSLADEARARGFRRLAATAK